MAIFAKKTLMMCLIPIGTIITLVLMFEYSRLVFKFLCQKLHITCTVVPLKICYSHLVHISTLVVAIALLLVTNCSNILVLSSMYALFTMFELYACRCGYSLMGLDTKKFQRFLFSPRSYLEPNLQKHDTFLYQSLEIWAISIIPVGCAFFIARLINKSLHIDNDRKNTYSTCVVFYIFIVFIVYIAASKLYHVA